MASPARALASILVLAGLGACTGAADDAVPPQISNVNIAIITDVAGKKTSVGTDAVRGAQLAVELINQAHPEVPLPLAASTGLPGLGEATLTLITSDSQGDPQQASDNTASVVEEQNAVGVVVADTPDAAAAVGSQAQRTAVPVIDALNTAEYLTELGLDWYFRISPTDEMLAENAFTVLRQRFPGTGGRLALLTEPVGTNPAVAMTVEELAVRSGHRVTVRDEQGSVEDRVDSIEDRSCDAIVAIASTSKAATEAAQVAAELTPPRPLIGLGPGFDALARVDAPSVLRSSPWSAELARRSPVGKAVTDLYQKLFNAPMTQQAASVFTATYALAVAIDQVGSADRAAIRGALRQLSLPATQMIMPWNGIRFSAEGQNELAAGVVEGWTRGAFRVVYPPEVASAQVVWTAP